MGQTSVLADDDCKCVSCSSTLDNVRTLVLFGRTGNGKSATGNSILGRNVFKSRASSSGVTTSCEMEATVLHYRQIVNVIDSPGLFDFTVGSELIGKEIVKCIGLAKDGIHAILVVFSVRTRFSAEEESALRSLQKLFGSKIVDYMIVIFTGGDELEENDETLDDYLGRECPEPLKAILSLCGNRYVLFDNKTKDEKKRHKQVQQLLFIVDILISKNGGQPYTDKLFKEIKKREMELQKQQREVDSMQGYSKEDILEYKKQMEQQAYNDQLNQITQMIESKLMEATTKLEEQLAKEQAARLAAEEYAKAAQMKSNNEIKKLRRHLMRAKEDLHQRSQDSSFKKLRRHFDQAHVELRRRTPNHRCTIL
ncbi:AIG1 [Trifolium pratense]|uniref:AIG1 n=1 Tax=Trifolium pratense TaxID=57577 RepID=A0A2K3PFQ5_TRIPR|nr:AIG1 [Trifolium pratense]